MDRTKRIMVKALAAETYCLNSTERPIDYGHCREIMIDKYGEERGSKQYDGMINSTAQGLHFVVATKILLEKRAMMQLLGLTGRLEEFTYEFLYDSWQEQKNRGK